MMKNSIVLFCALLCALSGSAFAAPAFTLTLDPAATGPGEFAAEEIRREAVARSLTVVSAGATAPRDAIRITLTVGAPAAMAAPQSYGIRVQNEQGQRSITVRGVDPSGLMYGGLDVAEAIRTGTLDTLKNSDHTPHIANLPRKLFDIDSFIKHPVLDTKRYVNIADFVKASGSVERGRLSPLALAKQLDRDGATALKKVASVRAQAKPSPTLECELTDIEAWCAYGAYFAEKLRGGVALAEARAIKDVKKQQQAVAALEKALGQWRRLAELGARFNRLPVPSNSIEPFSWASLTPAVERDIATARAGL